MHRASWIAEELAERGYAVTDDWLGRERAVAVVDALGVLYDAGRFTRAAVGVERITDRDVRGDETSWLDGDSAPATVLPLLLSLETLRAALAQALMLPLVEIECHAARYPVGGAYAPHIDDLRGSLGRRVSFAWYANDGWGPEDGGALRLHTAERLDVLPALDRLAVFRSDTVLHEVLPAQRVRWSVTGWMRLRRGFGVVLPAPPTRRR